MGYGFPSWFFLATEPMSMSSEEEAEPTLEEPSADSDHVRGKRRRHRNTLRDVLDEFASEEEAGGVPTTLNHLIPENRERS